MIENSLNIHGDEILYVGDHIYTDVSQSKVHQRWRTALIVRELEEEVRNFDLCAFSLITARATMYFLTEELLSTVININGLPIMTIRTRSKNRERKRNFLTTNNNVHNCMLL